MMSCWKNIIKSGIISVIVLKRIWQWTTVQGNISKAKIKSSEVKINKNFHNDGIPKEGSYCISLSVLLIDSVFKICKNCYPQVFLKECKYIIKEKTMT